MYAGLGNSNAAFEWLEKAFAAHDVHLVFLPVDPKWNPFRQDPRFVDLLRRCAFTSILAARSSQIAHSLSGHRLSLMPIMARRGSTKTVGARNSC